MYVNIYIYTHRENTHQHKDSHTHTHTHTHTQSDTHTQTYTCHLGSGAFTVIMHCAVFVIILLVPHPRGTKIYFGLYPNKVRATYTTIYMRDTYQTSQ